MGSAPWPLTHSSEGPPASQTPYPLHTRPAPVAPRACGECRGCAGDPIGDIPGSSDGWRVACIGDTGMGAGMLHEDPRAAPTGMLHEDPQGPADPMGMESELPTKSGNAAAARHGAMLPTPLHALRICGVWEADACVAGGAYDTPRHGGTEIVAGAQAMTVPPASLLLWGSLSCVCQRHRLQRKGCGAPARPLSSFVISPSHCVLSVVLSLSRSTSLSLSLSLS